MNYEILIGDVLDRIQGIPDNSVHCVVTSPPYYGLRDYGMDGQIGLEATPAAFVAKMTDVFREVRRVLRPDGTCWLNMGDSYAGSWGAQSRGNTTGEAKGRLEGTSMLSARQIQAHPLGITHTGSLKNTPGLKPKDLMGMPWRLAFALQDDGWWLRQDIIWAKPNPMPESVTDRCTKAHEYIFLLTKSERYFYDAEAIREKVTGNAHSRTGVGFGHGFDEVVKPRVGGVTPKSAVPGSGVKSNSSFNAALVNMVTSRNKRSVWEIPTEAFPEAHFATFPTKLVEPCILAGTSKKGCCAKCGAPWCRLIVRTEEEDTSAKGSTFDGGKTGARDGGDRTQSGPRMKKAHAGWEASCSCGAGVIPCTVMDPFNGSGTTGVVALKHRCDYIGIELNPEYAAMAERRLSALTAQGVLI